MRLAVRPPRTAVRGAVAHSRGAVAHADVEGGLEAVLSVPEHSRVTLGFADRIGNGLLLRHGGPSVRPPRVAYTSSMVVDRHRVDVDFARANKQRKQNDKPGAQAHGILPQWLLSAQKDGSAHPGALCHRTLTLSRNEKRGPKAAFAWKVPLPKLLLFLFEQLIEIERPCPDWSAVGLLDVAAAGHCFRSDHVLAGTDRAHHVAVRGRPSRSDERHAPAGVVPRILRRAGVADFAADTDATAEGNRDEHEAREFDHLIPLPHLERYLR